MKHWWLLWIMAGLSVRAFGQTAESAGLPFTLTWMEGKCVGCKIAADLGEIQFISRKEAWGIGYQFPPQGAADYIMVHTTDAGRTWNELPKSWQHAGPPVFTFLDSAHGWFSCWNLYCGGVVGSKLFRTTDGGKHWRLVSAQGVMAMVFADENHGIGKAFGIDDSGGMIRSADGGRTWSKVEIPHLRAIGDMIFLPDQIVWITDHAGDDLLFFRTIDAGHSWEEFRTTLPHEWADVREISFLDRNHGWLVLKHKDDDQIRVLATVDGGRTWSPVNTPSLRTGHWWASVVEFVSDKVGFLFVSEEDDPQSKGFEGQSVLFTADGGTHWLRFALPYSIYSCQILEGDLLCSASSKNSGFGVLTLQPK